MVTKPLCDVCRQHRAIVSFNDVQLGFVCERHVCATCFEGYDKARSSRSMVEVLMQGNCQFCGAMPNCITGLPGPHRLVMCDACGRKYKRLVEDELAAILKNPNRDRRIHYLRGLPHRIDDLMMKDREANEDR